MGSAQPTRPQTGLMHPPDFDNFVSSHNKALADLTAGGEHHAWVAVEAVPFKGLLGGEGVSCWMLFTYPDGTIDFEDDYDNSLSRELFSGTFRDECQSPGEGHVHDVRWASSEETDSLWDSVGIDGGVPMGYYYAKMSEQRGGTSITDDINVAWQSLRDRVARVIHR